MESKNRKVMIQFNQVSKVYRRGQIGTGSLRQDLESWWSIRHGREDPNSIVGQAAQPAGDRFEALDGINLTVYEGERVAIVGGNGAGKSTLLKLISGVTTPTTGSIDLYGRVTSMLEVGTGFHGEMTGRENIYMNGTILGMKRREIDAILDSIIDFSEVREFIDTPVKRYSSGMYVKLGFSVASHLTSEIVIMDEVLAVGDLAFQKKCIDKMRDAADAENRTILYVSHNMNTVRELCDRCIVLDRGRILYDGNVEEGIRFYSEYLMNIRGGDSELVTKTRRDKNITRRCMLEDVRVENGMLLPGDDLRFKAFVDSREDLDHVRLRLVVSNEGGTIVGMAYSDPQALRRGRNVLQLCVSTEPLAPGRYVCDIALFEFENNVQTRHDFARRVLAFQLEEKSRLFGKKWTAGSWGNVRLRPIVIERAEATGECNEAEALFQQQNLSQ